MNKQCSICKEIKSLDKFYRNRCQSDGFCHYCKSCAKTSYAESRKKTSAKWYADNKTRISERRKKLYLENVDEERMKSRKYYQKNKESQNERSKKYYWENRDELLEKKKIHNKAWYLKNKKKKNESNKQYYSGNKDKIMLKQKETQKINREQLADNYVKNQLTSNSILKVSDIPDELVKAKRQQIQLKRIIKGENTDE